MAKELAKRDKSYVDLSLAFKPSPLTSDITVLRNERAINNAIKNIVMFLPSEVPFDRDIGSNATRYLFELVDEATAALLSQEIERAILYCEPRVSFSQPNQEELTVGEYQQAEFTRPGELFLQDDLGVTVSANVDSDTYEVTVKYRIVGSLKRFVVQQILTPTR
jgi:phage baseplate assembly protein W